MWGFQTIDKTISKMLGFWSVSEILTFSLKICYASEERGKKYMFSTFGIFGGEY